MLKKLSSLFAALLLALGVATTSAPASAASEADAQAFITSITDRAIEILADKSMTQNDKVKAFDTLLSANVDMQRVARFVLGRYWRGVSDEKLNEYIELYRQYLIQARADQLQAFSNESINVKRAVAAKKGQFIVESEVVFTDGRQPASLDWRVRADENGNLKIVDIIVEGISMAITERDANVALVSQHNGSIDPLMDKLRQKIN